MSAGTTVSVEEYLARNESGVEYVDGALIRKSMPTWEHALIQGWLAGLISRLYPAYGAGSEVHSHLRETEIRLPDIAVERRSKLRLLKPKSHAETPPYLCVEILSPDDSFGETLTKLERYHAWGVEHCWLIDPFDRRAWIYTRSEKPLEVKDALVAGEIRIELTELFSVLD
jgi:Uma2 family endonuclease